MDAVGVNVVALVREVTFPNTQARSRRFAKDGLECYDCCAGSHPASGLCPGRYHIAGHLSGSDFSERTC